MGQLNQFDPPRPWVKSGLGMRVSLSHLHASAEPASHGLN